MSMATTTRTTSIERDTHNLARLFARSWKALKQQRDGCSRLEEKIEAEALGPRHFPVLINVAMGGPLSVSELADQIGLSVATTSLLVGQLSRSGLVERTEDDSDRRRTLVSLHEDYREVMDRWADEAVDPLRRTWKRMSPEARAHFMEGMKLLDEESRRGLVTPT
jgi:DNA-binding MarR family transcriptional regulator